MIYFFQVRKMNLLNENECLNLAVTLTLSKETLFLSTIVIGFISLMRDVSNKQTKPTKVEVVED